MSALDGHVSGTNSTGTVAVSLTTLNGSGVIVVTVATLAASVTSVTATGLTFTCRAAGITSGGGMFMQDFTAPYSSNFSGTIAGVVASAIECDVRAFGVSGASGFDAGGPQSATTFGTNASETTTNNCFVWFQACNASGGVSAPWTNVDGTFQGANGQVVGYQIVGPGTYTSAISAGTIMGVIVDALKSVAAAAANERTLTGVGT